ncbi:Hypothetical_protein [Hexamita inflata]|uniref:Hypothetical_protein n=1 Tax=Hexamita inflata TaxID=28002 RepID=A0ABP1K3B4_9EUKA
MQSISDQAGVMQLGFFVSARYCKTAVFAQEGVRDLCRNVVSIFMDFSYTVPLQRRTSGITRLSPYVPPYLRILPLNALVLLVLLLVYTIIYIFQSNRKIIVIRALILLLQYFISEYTNLKLGLGPNNQIMKYRLIQNKEKPLVLIRKERYLPKPEISGFRSFQVMFHEKQQKVVGYQLY